MFGFTKGQFSFVDLLDAVLDLTGPARVTVATWTAASADAAFLGGWCAQGRIRQFRLLIDYSFLTRKGGADAVARIWSWCRSAAASRVTSGASRFRTATRFWTAPSTRAPRPISDAAPAGEACDLRDKVVAHLGQKYGEVVISRGISTAGARTSCRRGPPPTNPGRCPSSSTAAGSA